MQPILLLALSCLAPLVRAQSLPDPETKFPREPSAGVIDKSEGVPAPLRVIQPDLSARPSPAGGRAVGAKEQHMANAAGDGIAAWFQDPDRVLFDTPRAGGALWARGNNYKASFDAHGWDFLAQAPAEAPDAPAPALHFELASVQVGGVDLELGAGAPTCGERRVEYRHAGVVEAIELRGREVEQTFTFATLPRRGELVVDIVASTDLAVRATDQGLAFGDDWRNVRYSAAVAVDARGERVAAATSYIAGHIQIRVPAAFVERASLPLVIDPVLASTTVVSFAGVYTPDVAWDEATQTWGLCFTQAFAAGDNDVYVARLDANMTVIGMTTIDYSTENWWVSRIANSHAYGLFLVVAQVWHVGYNAPSKISGRMMDNAGNVTAQGQFDIASTSVDEINPDVGGDPVAAAPTYFTVVWEHCFSATDHDIYAQQIVNNGSLRGAGPTAIQANAANQTNPSISKSDGGPPVATQRFTVVYQETGYYWPLFYENVHGALLTWDGVQVAVNSAFTFPLQPYPWVTALLVNPQVSSPSLPDAAGKRVILCACASSSNVGSTPEITGFVFDTAGNLDNHVNISQQENDPVRLTWPKGMPSVDCDGRRFVVAYQENFQAGPDLDTRVDTLAYTGGSVYPMATVEAGRTLGFSANQEHLVQVASRYSGSGAYSPYYCATDQRDNLTGLARSIEAFGGGAYATGGVSSRATGCGVHSVDPITGLALPGTTLTFTVNSLRGNFAGFLLGAPIAAVPVPGCPGCTIGVSGQAYIGRTLSLAIPLDPRLIGLPVSLQGFVFGPPGPCLTNLSLTNTVDFVVQ